jgi:hypothetical protein
MGTGGQCVPNVGGCLTNRVRSEFCRPLVTRPNGSDVKVLLGMGEEENLPRASRVVQWSNGCG